MKLVLKTLLVMALVPCFGLVAFAQESDLPQPSEKSIKTISLTEDGRLVGRITTAMSSFKATTPVEGISVSISRKGVVLASAKTNAKGEFEIADVKTGRYNLLAVGETALLASGINVTEFTKGSSAIEMVAMPAPLEIANRILTKYSKILANNEAAPKTEIKLVSMRVVSPSVTEGTVFGSVTALSGQPAKAQVVLIQGEKIVGEAVSENGEYEIENVKAGIYTLLAVSDSGFSVIGLEVLKAPEVKTVSLQGETPADITLADGGTFLLVPQNNQGQDDDDGGVVFFDDGGGAVVGGGGGPGGAGGGLAGLAGLGGLAGLAGLGNNNASPK